MKRITFKVSAPKEGSLSTLIKEVNKASCRILIDIENGFVVAENVNATMIDTVIELIDNYYTLLSVDIDNCVERDVAESAETRTLRTDKDDAVVKAEVAHKTLGPQSEDDLIIEKIEFENEYVEQLMNQFLKTICWAMFKKNAPEKELAEFIYTAINEVSMRYNKKESIAFSIGDVVDCNYGTHLVGEINGYHVPAIVCNISDSGMAYVVPISRKQENVTSHSYLRFTVPGEIAYDTHDYAGGTVILDKGKYVRPDRFNEVIGKATPEFLAKVLKQLATTFDFGGSKTKGVDDFSRIDENTITETLAPQSEETTEERVETETTNKKFGDVETALMETVGAAFEKLDSSKKAKEQIDSFLTDIRMSPTESMTEKMIRQSFVIACGIKKITYENIIIELKKIYPYANEDSIKANLKEYFKKWLENYPELAEKCPKISLMSLLKAFAKRVA